VGDYSIFVKKWADPHGGIHGYLHRFLESNDPTFQHIAIWTLLQLLESEDKKLLSKIQRATDVTRMVRSIAERNTESDEEEDQDGDTEVIALARRCVELLDSGSDGKKTEHSARRALMEG
jgi:vacuolar protein 8